METSMSQNAYEVCITGLIVSLILGLFLILSFHYKHKNELIANSTDPIATACALGDRETTACVALMGK